MTDDEIDAEMARAETARKARAIHGRAPLLGRWQNDRPATVAKRQLLARARRADLSVEAYKIAVQFEASKLECDGLLEKDAALRRMILADLDAQTKAIRGMSVQFVDCADWKTWRP